MKLWNPSSEIPTIKQKLNNNSRNKNIISTIKSSNYKIKGKKKSEKNEAFYIEQ